ncbi:hypothetical protein NQ317_001266 [Molorchus minor]|uniref:Gamma-glutamylcyclotransferase AIG2-like domain-containing protein n=1 Tax=Molorchus minor TaxID=1323400 RepID=A0ABQ9IW07_9CUCU|nr:hypothetical protein NQ317_001266 [Molorchus minor]
MNIYYFILWSDFDMSTFLTNSQNSIFEFMIMKTLTKYLFMIVQPSFFLHRTRNLCQREVYETDDNVLADLDELENHPNYYIRELRDFIPLNGGNTNQTIIAWVYVLKNFKRELLNEP